MVSPGGVWWRCGVGVWLSFAKNYSFPKLCTFFCRVKISKSILNFGPFSANFSAFEIILKPILELEHFINPCP